MGLWNCIRHIKHSIALMRKNVQWNLKSKLSGNGEWIQYQMSRVTKHNNGRTGACVLCNQFNNTSKTLATRQSAVSYHIFAHSFANQPQRVKDNLILIPDHRLKFLQNFSLFFFSIGCCCSFYFYSWFFLLLLLFYPSFLLLFLSFSFWLSKSIQITLYV